jgi:flagellar basal body-associated protein FliL
MKKGILIAIIIIILSLAGYVFVVKKSANRESIQTAPQKSAAPPVQPSPAAAIDTNDNLDQALQDLGQIE